jgi:hypothetical protein
MAYQYCSRCNTRYVPGCGEEAEHERCPRLCSLCGRLMDGRKDPGSCRGHSIEEARGAVMAWRRLSGED